MIKWQPIETAPKDGTKIIGIDAEGNVSQCYWAEYYTFCWHTGGTLPTMNAEPITVNPIYWTTFPELEGIIK